MAQWLKQSTAFTFELGPFLDDTDGKTAEASLTIAATDVYVSKAGAALAAKNDATALTGTGDALGYYACPLNTTDTGTLGPLRVHCHVAGALPVWQDFLVVPAQAYNSLIAGSDKLQVDAVEINSSTTAAARQANLATVCPTYAVNTGVNSPTNSGALIFWSDDCTEATADHFNGRTVTFLTGALFGQSLSITDYALDGAEGKFTCSVATETPGDGDTFTIA